MGKVTLANLIRRSWKTKSKYGMTGIGLIKVSGLSAGEKKSLDPRTLEIEAGPEGRTEDIRFRVLNGKGIGIKGMRLVLYKITFDTSNLIKYDIQNRIRLVGQNLDGIIKFNLLDRSKGKNKYAKIMIKDDTTVNFRQTRYNNLMLTIRPKDYYDTKRGGLKLRVGWLLSKICIGYRPILMYEKKSARYEESASVLFERLVDEKQKKVRYIINRDNPKLSEIDDKYKKKIIYKDSMKHIVSFFRCKTFIGTEMIAHALQLRSSRKLVQQKTQNPKNTFVFLQHGVMYMVSLSAEQRIFFKTPYKKYRVTASSELEKRHFVQEGEYKDEEVYVTGLAKFDKSTLAPDADKIVVMPTWRSWELAQIREDFKSSGYYRLINQIVRAVPDELKDKLVVLPHPLIRENMNIKTYKLKKYIPDNDVSYDDVLKKCKLLITDYSSISYDAFYRGSNVVFYWNEVDECMEYYGEGAHLMLDEKTAFGDVCYDEQELSESIANNYGSVQSDKMKARYKKIVEYDDNKNTDRIIKCLREDDIIS